MKIIKKGIVYRVTQGPFRYQAWPSLCMDEKGTLYAVCSGHRAGHVCPFGKDLMFKSDDGGENWTAPQIINDTWLDDRDAGITYLGGGKMLLAYFCHPKDVYMGMWRNWIVGGCDPNYKELCEGMLKCYENFTPEQNKAGSFIKRSLDYGNSWSEAIQVQISAPHGAVLTASGRLLYLGKETQGTLNRYIVDADDSLDPTPVEDRKHIFLYESFDEGVTWEKVSKLPVPEGLAPGNLHEPHIVELPSGELVASIWTRTSKGGLSMGSICNTI